MGGHIPRHVVPDVAISTLRLLLLIDLGVCLQAGPACYDPFGKLAVDDLPCNPTAVESFCCGAGWSCLTNQLCRDVEGGVEGGVEGSVARGTCTDKSWSSTECPDYCASEWMLCREVLYRRLITNLLSSNGEIYLVLLQHLLLR